VPKGARIHSSVRDAVALLLRLPAALEPRRPEFIQEVAGAHALIKAFAAMHGWSAHMQVFFNGGVEVFDTQGDLWERIKALCGLPTEAPLPTRGLAGALERGILLAITPEEYARVAPDYGTVPGAYRRLLAHEIAHRLHIAILRGDEDAMGPAWFYEGLAVVASGDLSEPPSSGLTWDALMAPGPGAYRRHAALLRLLMGHVPLQELVDRARTADFEDWSRTLLE